MDTAYFFLKSLVDPVVPVLLLLVLGAVLSLLKKRKIMGRAILFLSLVILYCLSIYPVSNFLCYVLEKDYLARERMDIGKLDVVLVLGGGVLENEYQGETMLSQRAATRLIYAVQVFRKSGAQHLLCSGQGTGRFSEAEVMALAAERLGVPKEKLKIDPLSQNTTEHAVEMDIEPH